MTKRVLLIDADVIAYKACSAVERTFEFEPGYWTWYADEEATKANALQQIEELKDTLKAKEALLCLTDSEHNYRLDVLPTYKGHRSSSKKPLLLKHIKQWMIDDHGAYFRPQLEGDDCMGILATHDRMVGEKVIVSLDKDMQTIPGLFYRPAHHGQKGKMYEITPEDADRFHLTQTLAGDVTDGYGGCPGIGWDTAEKIVNERIGVVYTERELKSGPNKGQMKGTWEKTEMPTVWEAIVSHFEKAGLTEEDAIVQARVARILRASEYNFKTREPILWTPERICI